ncbi:NIPSNAP family protein [Tengunoibacter tsumagoiensis]|uniref:NIPSNAP family containing protein n=1 Tax=Tengunoibacter tsumagoiensis TaxID=2014871 RepID=A0A402A4R6_9CHLR|nr:NIPSNAP family protein [Tengunoibacter tsumagoiensis]GCE14147.1 NIPSNAP family containing protein [Tengunoibacter tsumagoiensis]
MTDLHPQADREHTIRKADNAIIELRQYTLKPGRRDELITLFEEHFIEGQEENGAHVLGQFRRHDKPDQFVWLRGFSDMKARQQALQSFYYGPIWQEHREAANDTILDSDNVLLLKPASSDGTFQLDLSNQPAKDALETDGGIIIATLYTFASPVKARFIEFFEQDMVPVLHAAGATIAGYFVTEASANTFPVLPVREGEHIFAWFTTFANKGAYKNYLSTLTSRQAWNESLLPILEEWLAQPAEILELSPTRRSLLRHRFA